MKQPCDPGPGKTLLTIGQDLVSIEQYVSMQMEHQQQQQQQQQPQQQEQPTYQSMAFDPAATMVYTDIQTLRGLDQPVDYGSGIEYAQGLTETYSHSGIQLGLWLNGTSGCQDIVEGRLEDNIRKLYTIIDQWKTPKVFLRVGYEFDNPYFGYSQDPSIFQQAFQRMVHVCEEELGYNSCHDQIDFCWHSWAAPRWIDDLEAFYPGDDYVDWVGISIFQQLYPWANTGTESSHFAGGSRSYIVQVLELAQQHDKPVMIAESTPFGGIYRNGPSTDIWNLWFVPVLELIEQYDIRMWSYIDCDWDSQPMWHNVGFGDSRLVTSPHVMTKWREEVLENPRFVLAPLENCGTSTGSTTGSTVGSNKRSRGTHDTVLLTATTIVVSPTRLVSTSMIFGEPFWWLLLLVVVLGVGGWVLSRQRQSSTRHVANEPQRLISLESRPYDYGAFS